MKSSPSQHAGVVGGTLNSTYQLGAAIVLSITASLKANYIEPAPAGDVGGHGVVRWKACVPCSFVPFAVIPLTPVALLSSAVTKRRLASSPSSALVRRSSFELDLGPPC